MDSNNNLKDTLVKALENLKAARLELNNLQNKDRESIAIIGMSCRFPGGANNLYDFWKLVRAGHNLISDTPQDRWDGDKYSSISDELGKTVNNKGGFLNTPIDYFDNDFFGISLREGNYLDPQHRLLLEVTWEAIEDAAINVEELKGKKVGVFTGICGHDYAILLGKALEPKQIDAYYALGNASSAASGRVSYILGLQGPAISVDTACSSSLVAVHQACESLRRDECEIAIVGGVNLMLTPEINISFSRAGMLSPEGMCKSFDEKANGYVRGEGCGVVILKKEKKAIHDHDNIWAIIRGSAINQNGHNAGLTVPNATAQVKVIRQALKQAQLTPDEIDYIEAHATGTKLGDPIEMQALAEVFGGDSNEQTRSEPLIVSCVKTNIGHLEAAAGIAGLIKTVISMKFNEIPKTLNFDKLNPLVNLNIIPAVIPKSTYEWPRVSRPRRAGISSFGFTGSNVHVIIEEPPKVEENLPDTLYHVLQISAHTKNALQPLVKKYLKFLEETEEKIQSICFSSQISRTSHKFKLNVSGKNIEELIYGLKNKIYIDDEEAEKFKYPIDSAINKISLPTYPFLGKRNWFPINEQINSTLSLISAEYMYTVKLVEHALPVTEIDSYPKEICLIYNEKYYNAEYVGFVNALEELLKNKGNFVFKCDINAVLNIINELVNKATFVDVASFTLESYGKLKTPLTIINNYQSWMLNQDKIDSWVIFNPKSAFDYVLHGLYKTLQWECSFKTKCINGDSLQSMVEVLFKELSHKETIDILYQENVRYCYTVDKDKILENKYLSNESAVKLNPDAVYIITGGLGWLGFNLMQNLLTKGARNIILISRREKNTDQNNEIEKLKKQYGCTIQNEKIDVTDYESLKKIIHNCSNLAGVFHLAGTEISAAFTDYSAAMIEDILSPKIIGAEYLHNLTKDLNLDYFVLFSSIASMLGSNRQSPYIIANSYLDKLADLRKKEGLPITHVQWGPWEGEGMGAKGKKLGATDDIYIPLKEGMELLLKLLKNNAVINLGVISPKYMQFMQSFNKNNTLFKQEKVIANNTTLQQYYSKNADERLLFIEEIINQLVCKVLNEKNIDKEQGFFQLGMDSIMAVELFNLVQKEFRIQHITPSLVFDYPSIRKLSTYISNILSNDKAIKEIATDKNLKKEPIAIIGMECKFPASNNIEEFWLNLISANDCVSFNCGSRWDNKEYHYKAGFIDHYDMFDADFFNISNREAVLLDPQQRLLLETTWLALERTGINPDSIRDTAVGVFVGVSQSEYAHLLNKNNNNDFYTATGTALNTIAGRISFYFGLQGPSMAIDTACSSSLVALHEACNSLNNNECGMAIVAGINFFAIPESFAVLQNGNMLSPDGECRAFDVSANGYARGEGCGVVILKKVSDAVRDHDTIFSTIIGSAVNQDGASSNLTVPNGIAQDQVILHALNNAGVKPNDVTYIEAHGTGTLLGDPIEMASIQRVYGKERKYPLIVSSVKTNIGHLESAAGIASIIKVTLSLQNRKIPTHLHFKQMNPAIETDSNILIPLTPIEWTADYRIAGISSFGFSGTNAHVILQSSTKEDYDGEIAVDEQENTLYISAKTEKALAHQISNYINFLNESKSTLSDICYTSKVGRKHFSYTIKVMGKCKQEIIDKLIAGDFIQCDSTELLGKYYEKIKPLVPLPTYPFQHKRYWPSEKIGIFNANVHPFMQHMLTVPDNDNLYLESKITMDNPDFIKDHVIYNNPVIAGACYLSMALSLMKEKFRANLCRLYDIDFIEAVALADIEDEVRFLIKVIVIDNNQINLEVYTKKDNNFRLKAKMAAEQIHFFEDDNSNGIEVDIAKKTSYDLEAHMNKIKSLGLNLGAHFLWLEKAFPNKDELIVIFRDPAGSKEKNFFVLHPGHIDSCFQSLFALDTESINTLSIPLHIDEFIYDLNAQPFKYAREKIQKTNTARVKADFTLFSGEGVRVGSIKGFIGQPASREALQNILMSEKNVHDLFYEMLWSNKLYGESVQLKEYVEIFDARNQENAVFTSLINLLLDFIKSAANSHKTRTKIIIITEHAYLIEDDKINIHQSLLNGFIKTAILEHPDLNIKQIDVDNRITLTVDSYLSILAEEDIIAVRNNKIFFPRLVKKTQAIKSRNEIDMPLSDAWELEQTVPGELNGLKLVANKLCEVKPDEIKILVKAVGLNFRDVLVALGLYPGEARGLGGDFSGIVCDVGSNVKNFKLGDKVFGVTQMAFRSHIVTMPEMIVKIPKNLDCLEAAALPVVMLTAHYCLDIIAKIKKGDKVLIHTGAGGVGLAAIQFAKKAGATIYTTASKPKWKYLRDMGVDNIYDSRNTDYEAAIKKDTDNIGVDIILNTLTSKGFKEASLGCLKKNGIFIEISKRNIYTKEEINNIRPDVKYEIVAIDNMFVEKKELIASMLTYISEMIEAGQINNIPITTYPLAHITHAMRSMQTGENIGKIVIEMPPLSVQLVPNATYLITGGMGGIGLELAQYLIEKGATNIMLVGRHLSQNANNFINGIKDNNICVKTYVADMSDMQQVLNIFDICEKNKSPIKGVFHLAGTIKDTPIDLQDNSTITDVISSKAISAWNLSEVVKQKNIHLDYFVLFSSVSSLIGSLTQSNYAAANSFLDGLASHMRESGFLAQVVNWGPWAEVGMAKNLVAMHNRMGFNALSTRQALTTLDYCLRFPNKDFAILAVNWEIASKKLVTVPSWLRTLVKIESSDNFLEKIKTVSLDKRKEMLHAQIINVLKDILGNQDFSFNESNKDFLELGMDSLMLVEFKNRIQSLLDIQLPNSLMYDVKNIEELLQYLYQQESLSELFGLEKIISCVETKYSPLRCLRATGKKEPLFFVHGIDGSAEIFLNVAQNITVDRPIYAFQGFESIHNIKITSIEQRAAYYVDYILKVQPDGRYYLSGWSMGAAVAFEMAAQLIRKGKEVAFVGLIDGVAAFATHPIDNDSSTLFYQAATLYLFINNISIDKIKNIQEHSSKEEILKEISSLMKNQPHSMIENEDYINLIQQFIYQLTSYQLKKIDTPIIMFCPSIQTPILDYFSPGVDKRWDDFASSITRLMVNGDHYTMLKPDDNTKLLNYLNELLK